MDKSDSFFHLDQDHILQCVEDWGLSPTGHCLALNSLENRVYRIGIEQDADDGYMGVLPSIVVKFYRPGRWTKEQIQEEHDFLFQLKEEEIPVLTPLVNNNKESIQSLYIQKQNTDYPIYYTILPTLSGRIVEEFNFENLPAVGRLLARIHNVGSSQKAIHRIHMNVSHYAEPALYYIINNDFMSANTARRLESIAKKIFQSYNDLSQGIPSIRIHGDCHKGNLLQQGNEFTFLDFDDFMTGIPAQDLWMLLPFGEESSEYAIDLFMEGYREFRDFSYEWFRTIEPLRAIRYIYYSSWIAKRWNDPSFPNAFPHFGTESYWEREVRDLEELYYKIDL